MLISLNPEKEISHIIMDIIVSQTNYTPEEASALLEKHNGDYMTVIRNYLGAPPPKQKSIVSVNQEIYRMLRKQVDISEYNKTI